MAGKKKPERKVDRDLGKPRTNAQLDAAHRAKPGTMSGMAARASGIAPEGEKPPAEGADAGSDDCGAPAVDEQPKKR
jgi:hypothetical protein